MVRLEHESAEKLKKDIRRIVGASLDLNQYRVFFFGSRVSGKGDDRSDIDIGIEGPEEIPAETMNKIKEEIDELPLLYKIDVVDFKNVSLVFRDVALTQIELIKDHD